MVTIKQKIADLDKLITRQARVIADLQEELTEIREGLNQPEFIPSGSGVEADEGLKHEFYFHPEISGNGLSISIVDGMLPLGAFCGEVKIGMNVVNVERVTLNLPELWIGQGYVWLAIRYVINGGFTATMEIGDIQPLPNDNLDVFSIAWFTTNDEGGVDRLVPLCWSVPTVAGRLV